VHSAWAVPVPEAVSSSGWQMAPVVMSMPSSAEMCTVKGSLMQELAVIIIWPTVISWSPSMATGVDGKVMQPHATLRLSRSLQRSTPSKSEHGPIAKEASAPAPPMSSSHTVVPEYVSTSDAVAHEVPPRHAKTIWICLRAWSSPGTYTVSASRFS